MAGRVVSVDDLELRRRIGILPEDDALFPDLTLVVLGEDLNIGLSSDRLRRFPLDGRSLIALRVFSLFLSPIAWLASIVSLGGLSALLSSAHPLLGILAGLCSFASTIGIGLSVSASRSSTFRQTMFAIVRVLNANVTLNCLGWDRPAGLTRYFILPIRRKDLVLA